MVTIVESTPTPILIVKAPMFLITSLLAEREALFPSLAFGGISAPRVD